MGVSDCRCPRRLPTDASHCDRAYAVPEACSCLQTCDTAQHGSTVATLCEDEAESPYENVQPGQVPVGQDGQGARPSPGPWRRLWSVPAGLLAACLLLLAVAVALGLCYLQVTRRLQDASRAHAAERGRLSQQVSVQEQSLEQAQLELARARAELQRAWLEGNSSRLELGHRDAELEHVTGTLRRTETELQDVKGKLNASEITVSSLRACVNTDCCPPGWVLYRGKCLFISAEKKSWWDSKEYCESKSSLLLVQGRWESWTLPHFMTAVDARYWIGAMYSSWRTTVEWLDKTPSMLPYYMDCGASRSGEVRFLFCSEKLPWICEQAPELSSASKTLFPLLAKG
ncbi:B-cell differentiation antigen CD72-like isoform X3 [Struthio camelus]|uniref:B-cell differentiation antigen CD72-like isoform X3 n=1 Tax=Struthio camelus TaxID=8801 RepID=UPI003603ACC8